MARTFFIPGHGVIVEDGEEDYFVPGHGVMSEDNAPVAAGNDPDTDAALFIAGQQQPVMQPIEIVAY